MRDDTVSRSAVMDSLCAEYNRHYMEGGKAGLRLAWIEKAVNDTPTAVQWTPVEERLPEKTGKYLVTVKNGNVCAGTYSAFDHKFGCAAVAWMPLPEPYKEDSDE